MNKGKRTEEQNRKNSERQKGKRTGADNHFFGKHHTLEAKKANSDWHKGKTQSEESNKKRSIAHKGIPCSEKAKKKISIANIGRRRTEEQKKKMSIAHKGIPTGRTGEKSPNWKGGISFEPYCSKFNKPLKEKIRDKFERKCFLCNKPESTEKTCLSVHHIDYDKDQGCNGKTFELVPLCRSCHSKTNGEREEQQIMIINKLRDMNDTCN